MHSKGSPLGLCGGGGRDTQKNVLTSHFALHLCSHPLPSILPSPPGAKGPDGASKVWGVEGGGRERSDKREIKSFIGRAILVPIPGSLTKWGGVGQDSHGASEIIGWALCSTPGAKGREEKMFSTGL